MSFEQKAKAPEEGMRTDVWSECLWKREEDLCILTAEAIHTLFVGIYTVQSLQPNSQRGNNALCLSWKTEPEVESLFTVI